MAVKLYETRPKSTKRPEAVPGSGTIARIVNISEEWMARRLKGLVGGYCTIRWRHPCKPYGVAMGQIAKMTQNCPK